MIERLQLRTPIFAKTAVYGHFSADRYPWERLDAVAELQRGL
jgi:S-adenosylmethionine synthetase